MEEIIENNDSLDVDKSSDNSLNNENEVKAKGPRKSGIELLKIIGMLLIVISHVYCTITGVSSHASAEGITDYIVPIASTTDFSNIILRFVSVFGNLGNAIFFICSAWFLLDKEQSNKKRLFRLFCDLFIVNVLCLIGIICYKGFSTIGLKACIKSIFPFYFGQSWYVVYYILFVLISPFLNYVIKSLDQKKHFLIACILFVLYMVLSVVKAYPGSSNLVTWISFYFVISYFKNYGTKFINSKKANLIVLFSSIVLMLVLHLIINFAGMKISFLSGKVGLSKNCNFIIFFIAFSAFNLFNKMTFSSKAINYIASLTLVIYLFHDNVYIRVYIKPENWTWIYNNIGYQHFLLIFFGYALTLFAVSGIISLIYNLTLQKLVHKLSDKIYNLLANLIEWCQTKLINVIK